MADKNGHIDMTYQAMSALTGWPIDLLKQAITELSAPDPESRSDSDEGRRLLPLDEGRSWGWKVVNHGKYREKARKAMQQIEATSSGRDAERKRLERVQRSPAVSGADRLSDSDAYTDSDKSKSLEGSQARPAQPRKRCPEDFAITPELSEWAKVNAPNIDTARETEKFRDWEFKTGRRDWAAAWRNWMRKAHEGFIPQNSEPLTWRPV